MDEGLALVIVAIITVSGNAFVTILITILTLLSNVHITKIANADKVHEFKIVEVDDVGTSDRGEKGIGSTGRL